MSERTPIEWVNSLQAHLVLAEQHGRTSVQVNVSDFEILTDVEMQLLTLEAEVERLQARERELTEALRDIASYDEVGGCCPYGCDTPTIDKTALAAVSAETP